MATIDPAALYPDSLLSSRFPSRFFYFDISSLFYTDERPRGRTKRSTSREKFYKHPIKNVKCVLAIAETRHFSRNVFTKVMFYRKR